MSNFETFSELKIATLERVGEVTNGTSDYDATVEEQMNQMNRALYSGGNEFGVDLGEIWEWARSKDPGVLTLLPPYETGTVSLTQGSASGTFGTAPTGLGSLVGHFFIVTNRSTIYRISAHTADATAFTLDQIYLEDTGTTLGFRVVKLDYELAAGIERLTQTMRCFLLQTNEDPFGEIAGTDPASFSRNYPLLALESGTPDRFTIIHESNGLFTVRFNKYPSTNKTRVEYEYIPRAPNLVLKTFLDAAVNTTTEVISISNHGFVDGQQVKLTSTGTLPAGLALNTVYFIISSVFNTSFKLSATYGGSAVNITAAAGGGTHTISVLPTIPLSQRRVLMYAAAHFIMVDKSDSRVDYYARQTQSLLQAMVTANRKTKRHFSKNKGKLIARMDQMGLNSWPRVFDP